MYASLRLFLHARRRDKKLARRVANAQAIVMCSHTKSGRTWLQTMISSVYHQTYDIDPRKLIQYDNFHNVCKLVPKIHFGNTSVESKYGYVVARAPTHVPLVFLVRDPRDTAASFYYHLKYRASELELYRKNISRSNIKSMSLFDFMMSPYGLERVIAHGDRAFKESTERRCDLVVRYEDMRSDPFHALKGVMAVIDNVKMVDKILHRAVEFSSFDNMRQMEKIGFFDGDRIGGGNEENKNSSKVRRGMVGGYREDLTPDQLRIVDSRVNSSLLVRAYYQPSFLVEEKL